VSARSEPATPWWVRRPEVLHVGAYAVTALVLAGQLVAVVVTGSDRPTVLAVLLAGAGAALSWWRPWPGLLLTGAASFAVTAVGRDPLSVWMMAVLVLFSVTLRGGRPVVATAVVALCQLGAFMTVGGFRGGGATGVAALFSALAGGATGAGLRVYQDHWWAWEQRAEAALATREIEATRRVGEERLRIARDLHDVVAHHISVVNVQAGVARHLMDTHPEQARSALGLVRDASKTVLTELSAVLGLLRAEDGTSPAEPAPGLSRLPALVESVRGAGLDLELQCTGQSYELAPVNDLTAYRVVQESLTNALKYGSGRARLLVDHAPEGVTIDVVNPLAPDRPATSGGHGLIGMRERLDGVHGWLTAGPDGAGSWVLRAGIPRGQA
jgi:signal transduction histidine kinase